MGKRIDALLGRGSLKSAKLKATSNLAISRLAVLKNQRQAKCSIARSDVLQLLNLGQHDRALLRVEHVIKEQNMLDVFVIVEGYCNLLTERINQLEHEKVCPDELREAISSLIFAATRCGEFPELQELRAIFTAKFGKEFTARAVELRNNCGVNPKMIQKLSTRMPSHETRLKVLKEIAKENDIVLQLEESTTDLEEATKEEKGVDSKEDHHRIPNPPMLDEDGAVKGKYKDVADAAQAAFESAAYAAAAARAAVELSRSESGGSHHPPYNSPRLHTTKAPHTIQTNEEKDVKGTDDEDNGDVEGGGFDLAEIQPANTEDKSAAENLNEDRKPISMRTKPKHRWALTRN
nr:Spindle pole body protein [Ipomoea batatas]GME13395.1 Spindle pole body protein [Ipomoea batatas]GME19933.1 Spindle pole body protein [Ipomoea batatas]